MAAHRFVILPDWPRRPYSPYGQEIPLRQDRKPRQCYQTEGANLLQHLATEDFTFGGQASPLVLIEQKAPQCAGIAFC